MAICVCTVSIFFRSTISITSTSSSSCSTNPNTTSTHSFCVSQDTIATRHPNSKPTRPGHASPQSPQQQHHPSSVLTISGDPEPHDHLRPQPAHPPWSNPEPSYLSSVPSSSQSCETATTNRLPEPTSASDFDVSYARVVVPMVPRPSSPMPSPNHQPPLLANPNLTYLSRCRTAICCRSFSLQPSRSTDPPYPTGVSSASQPSLSPAAAPPRFSRLDLTRRVLVDDARSFLFSFARLNRIWIAHDHLLDLDLACSSAGPTPISRISQRRAGVLHHHGHPDQPPDPCPSMLPTTVLQRHLTRRRAPRHRASPPISAISILFSTRSPAQPRHRQRDSRDSVCSPDCCYLDCSGLNGIVCSIIRGHLAWF